MNRELQTKLNQYAKTRNTRKKWLTVIASLCAVVAICTSYLLINPADTSHQETFCGFEEHKEHVDTCYERILVCPLSEEGHTHSESCYEEKQVLTCSLFETDGHKHSDACYGAEKYFSCGLEETDGHRHNEECYEIDYDHLLCELPIHEHTLQCFSNPEADVETAAVWERTFDKVELTGNWNEDVLAIAQTQLGYSESTKNYKVLEDGTTMKGYTRYGAWNDDPYGDWDADFCSFCISYADVQDFPLCDNCADWIDQISIIGRYFTPDTYTPNLGDLIFFDYDNNGIADQVGFVYEIADNRIKTIEGNKSNCVGYGSYALNDSTILGYGILPENPNAISMTENDIEKNQNAFVLPTVSDESEVGGHVFVTQAAPKKLLLKASASKALMGYSVFTLGSDAGNSTEPLSVEDYIPARDAGEKQAVRLEYKEKDGETDSWIDVTTLDPDDTIPGDAKLRLNIEFEKVNILDLQAAGYQMAFTLPELMRNPTISEKITSGSTEVGTLKVENGTVIITFNDYWVDEHQQYEKNEQGEDDTSKPIDSFINGDFWVSSDINLTEAGKLHPGEVHIGDMDITVNFDPETVGKYGEVNITKSDAVLSEDETTGVWYLTYTLTVEAGEDGCPDISVKDIFDANTYTGAYELLGATKKTSIDTKPVSIPTTGITTTATEGGETVNEVNWTIGDMNPHDIYTLTYRVPLADGYIGGQAKQALDNRATAFYTETVEKSHDDTSFTPKTDVTISKLKTSDLSIINTAEGGYYIYRLEIKVPADTTYPLENVIIKDALDGTIAGRPATDDAVRKYLSYDLTDDQSRWEDNSAWCTTSGQNATQTTRVLHDYEPDIIFTADSDGDGKHNEGFSVNLGTLEPGTTVYFRYKVKIDPGVFAEIGDADGKINNTAGILLDGDETPYKNSNRSDTITHKQWSRKLGGERNNEELRIPIGTADGVYIYDSTDKNHPVKPTAHPADDQYVVPAGSYLYQIVANETGDWDITSASMTDTLQKAWMEYQGYVRVDAYSITSPVAGTTDAEVIANMSALSPAMTSWVKVDGLTSFSFAPADVFKDENGKPITGDYAYLLTYYAKPETEEVLNNVTVGNTVAMTGDVISEGTKYTLIGVEASADIVVQANTTFTAEKLPWYYAKASEEVIDNYDNGALYWVIKADGPLDKGTKFDDYTGATVSYYHSNSVEGIYKGNLGDTALTSYRNLASLKAAVNADENLTLSPLSADTYSIKYYVSGTNINSVNDPDTNNSQRSVVTLEKQVILDPGESLYIIYRTEPSSLPTGNTGSKNYQNSLMTKLPEQGSYTDPQTVTKAIHTQEYMYKQGYIGEYYDRNDGKGLTITWNPSLPDYGWLNINGGTTDGQPIETGTYIGWYIRLDHWNNMNGRYRVIDRIPDGLTPEFVALISWDTNFTNGYGYHSVQIPSSELPEGNWTEHVTVMTGSRRWSSSGSYYGASSYTFYWYTDENNRVLFDLDNFNLNMTTGHDVQLMIGTRVADPDVLMHDKQGSYTNTAEIYDSEGYKIDQSGDTVSITKNTLDKKLNGEQVNPLPFTITVNKMGEDLIPGIRNVSIVDTMSDNLRLDPATIEVKNLLTGQVLEPETEWVVAVNGQTFTLTVPDGQPLLVTYSAYLNAAPNEKVTVWNDTYWQGSNPPTTHTVDEDEYSYIGGGSASADTPPRLEIIKNDANNALRTLSGASFKVERMNVDETTGELTKDTTFTALTGTTTTDGKLSFANGLLEVNRVYCVTETEAPTAYYLDETPHYFIVAKQVEGQDNTKAYPAFLSLLNTDNQNPGADGKPYVELQYYEVDSKYSINIYDSPIEYELPKTGGIGTTLIYALGVMLMAGAVICRSFSRRKRERRFK